MSRSLAMAKNGSRAQILCVERFFSLGLSFVTFLFPIEKKSKQVAGLYIMAELSYPFNLIRCVS